jgi:hypothetical protein
MAAQVLLAIGVVLIVVLLILLARARAGRSIDDRADAWSLIGEEIDAHIEALAAGYLEARSGRDGGRPGHDRFGQETELFIGDVLWQRAERSEPWLREALREILVLERDAVYGEVRKRVEAYLHQPSLVEPARPARARIRT